MRDYNTLVAENLYLRSELAERDRIIKHYRDILEKDVKETEYNNFEEKKISWFSKLIDKIYDHLPQWIFIKE